MTAFNVVRFRVKPGEEERFLDHLHKARSDFKGFLGGALIKTAERTYCEIGEWRNFQSIVAARPQMIMVLDGMRHMLEDLGGGLGVTDPVSGEVVLRMTPPKPAMKKRPARASARKQRPAKKRKRQ